MLLQGNCVKRVLGETSLSLEAKSGESFLVRTILCEAHADDKYLVLRTDRKTVGVYRTYGRAGNHLGHAGIDWFPLNLMEFLATKDVNVTIPVGEGQTFSIDGINEATEIVVTFDRYSAGDIMPTMPNGSESKEYTFMQYMTASDNLAAVGDLLLDVSLSPGEFIDFPCGKVVPANTTVKMLGLVGNPFRRGSDYDAGSWTTFVKLVKDRETLFDIDRDGLVFRALAARRGFDSYCVDMSLIGGVFQVPDWAQTGDIDLHTAPVKPLMFEPALEFVSGEELLVKLTCTYLASNPLTVDNIDLAAILNVKVA